MITQRLQLSRWLLLAVIGLLGPIAPARAEFLTAYTGNTSAQAGHPVSVDGTYNFAVLDKTLGGTAGNVFGAVSNSNAPVNDPARYAQNFDQRFVAGAGSGALDTSARYLYLVQVVNNGPNQSAIKDVFTALNPGLVTSWGYFGLKLGGLGAGDDRGAVDANNNLGPDGHPFDGLAYSPTNRPFVLTLPTGDPGILPAGVTVDGSGFDISFGAGGLLNGQRSVLIGFTSNDAPKFVPDGENLSNGAGGLAFGESPIPAPEPSALVLLGLGGVGLGFGGWIARRRKRRSYLALA
jgi:hypothetical protein